MGRLANLGKNFWTFGPMVGFMYLGKQNGDAVRNDLPLLEDVPATIQERAWSSPIWYAP